ncbi:MAG: VWA domain-containing protein [Vicinamibacteria bacterium]|nr:VWA domain-containing protein [Vicinamibacteria bacterium]
MRRLCLLACGFAVLLGTVPEAQQPAPLRPADQPVFRLSVSLVQLDAVVTDKQGRHVTTLGRDDFEVYQDGRPQPIVAVSYVDSDDGWVDTSGLPPLPVEALKPEDARRVIAVVVDDQRMSFESIYYARRGIGQFFDRQFQPGDLGMLVTTSGTGVSQLTYSPKVLKAASSRLRYSLWNVQAASALAPVDGVSFFGVEGNFLERTFAESAILRIADAISAVKKLPGRKSVVLVSEGFSVYGFGWDNSYIREMLQRLVDRSNRAGVVIYAVDPRGLVVTGITAADNVRGGGAGVAAMRSAALRESQDGLRFVTGETGGFAVVNSNDLGLGFGRIMADQRGYYLIGYQPEAGTLTFKSDRQFRKLKIKVKPKGLRVRTRAGFYGQATE